MPKIKGGKGKMAKQVQVVEENQSLLEEDSLLDSVVKRNNLTLID